MLVHIFWARVHGDLGNDQVPQENDHMLLLHVHGVHRVLGYEVGVPSRALQVDTPSLDVIGMVNGHHKRVGVDLGTVGSLDVKMVLRV